MNVNLLPQENIQNRAPLYSAVVVVIVLIVGAITLFLSSLLTESQIRSKQEEQNLQSLVLARTTREIDQLKKEQASLMQVKLAEIKSTSYLFSPLLREIDQTVTKNQMSILTYSLAVTEEDNQVVDAESAVQQTSQGENIMPVTLEAESLTLTHIGATLDELSSLGWVDSAHFKTMTGDKKSDKLTVANTTYLLNIVPERLAIKGEAGK